MKKDGKKSARSKIQKSFSVHKGGTFTKERAAYIAEGVGLVLLVGELFYGTPLAGLLLLTGVYYYVCKRMQMKRKKELMRRKDEFRECMLLVRSALSAGYSAENAWKSAYRQIGQLYGKDTAIVQELSCLSARIDMNETIEDVLDDFAENLELEEARNFAEVFRFAKRSGGNFNKMVSDTIDRLSDGLDVEREIRTVTSAKRFEQMIMNLIPAGIILYLRLTSPGYLDVLYGNMLGFGIMTAALIAYVAAYEISGRMVEIEV